MAWQYMAKLLPALFLLLAGILIAGDSSSQRCIIGMLANWGMANEDSEASIQASASMVVRIFFGISLVFFLWTGLIYYHHHRTIKVRPLDNSTSAPYEKKSKPAPAVTPQPSESAPAPESSGGRQGAPVRPYTTSCVDDAPVLVCVTPRYSRSDTAG